MSPEHTRGDRGFSWRTTALQRLSRLSGADARCAGTRQHSLPRVQFCCPATSLPAPWLSLCLGRRSQRHSHSRDEQQPAVSAAAGGRRCRRQRPGAEVRAHSAALGRGARQHLPGGLPAPGGDGHASLPSRYISQRALGPSFQGRTSVTSFSLQLTRFIPKLLKATGWSALGCPDTASPFSPTGDFWSGGEHPR